MEKILRKELISRLKPICDSLKNERLSKELNWEQGARLVADGYLAISGTEIIDPIPRDIEIVSSLIYLTAQAHRYGGKNGERANDSTRKIIASAWQEHIMPYDRRERFE